MNPETKQCQNCQQNFVIEPEDFAFYEKMKVPVPTWCPECRMKRKLIWRNERTLYKRVCDLCGKSIITMYHPKSPYTVYCLGCWYSDQWDISDYSINYDPDKPFFHQFNKLVLKVPKVAVYATSVGGAENINSDYTNFAGGNKDCYLVFNSGNNENCAYSRGLKGCKDVFDSYFGNNSELIYEGIGVQKSSRVFFGDNVSSSLDSYFLLNCSGCSDCFACVNLRNKSYHFFNQPLSKEEYKSKVSSFLGSYQKLEEVKRQFAEFALQSLRKENRNLKFFQCVGDFIFESKNCFGCYEVSSSEDSKYLFYTKLVKDCYDVVGYGYTSELLLETVGVGYSARVVGSWFVEQSHDLEYCIMMKSSEDCFGCDGLKNAKFSILNKQYSREEYQSIREKIIQELKKEGNYGLFLPSQMCFFAYNESLAQDEYPLTKEEAIKQGFRWEDDIPRTSGKETLLPENIPDHIKDVKDEIVKEVLKCIICGNNYKITHQELEFYRKMLLPIPRQCFFCRHLNRLSQRGSFKLYSRFCSKCHKDMTTTYTPNRPEIIYCESCYQGEVV